MTPSAAGNPAGSDDPAEAAKRAAGRAAVAEVRSGTTIGLGTGSTVRHFLDAVADAIRAGQLNEIRGVATSEQTSERAHALGLDLVELPEAGALDLAVDGADEVDPQLDLIKGLGGALLREKMVVQAARRFVVIADEGKRVPRLGARSPLPVEVLPFAWEVHLPFFRALGADPVPRRDAGDRLVLTDNGNPIIDLLFEGGLPDAEGLERELHARAGVVATGLFLGVADRVIVGTAAGTETLDRSEPSE